MKMRFLLFTICVLFVNLSSTAQDYDITYKREDSIKVVKLLNSAKKQPDGTNLVLYLARQLKGLPYVAHTLDISNHEKLIINLRQLDCTTLVENVAAMYLCLKQKQYTFKSFCDNLLLIRYRGGEKPKYTGRLHYFTDWVVDNTKMGFCKEIQSPTPPFNATQTINVYYMSKHPEKYAQLKDNPSYVSEISKIENNIKGKVYKYIPKDAITNSTSLRKVIHNGDIIATTTKINGLDVQHLGFAVWKKDGLHLLNASSLRHKVVEESLTLYNYLKQQKTMTGVRIVRLH